MLEIPFKWTSWKDFSRTPVSSKFILITREYLIIPVPLFPGKQNYSSNNNEFVEAELHLRIYDLFIRPRFGTLSRGVCTQAMHTKVVLPFIIHACSMAPIIWVTQGGN